MTNYIPLRLSCPLCLVLTNLCQHVHVPNLNGEHEMTLYLANFKVYECLRKPFYHIQMRLWQESHYWASCSKVI